jgi:hypothetical protein
MNDALDAAAAVGLGIDRDTDLRIRLARGQLCFVQGKHADVIAALKDTPELMLAEKAGETSGLRAQLVARAYQELGLTEEFKSSCQWLRDKCPEDSGNKLAKDWGRAALDAP